MSAKGREFKNHVYEQFARIGKALASPTRLELLELLCQGERSVEVLAGAASQTVANTSRHLQVLLGAQLVKTQKKGNYIIYQLADEGVCKFWKSMQELGEQRLAELKRAANDFFGAHDDTEAVDRKELLNRVQRGKAIVLDVRPVEEFRAGHIQGAVSIPLKGLKNRTKELTKNKEIVAYCRGPYCVLAHEAVEWLKKNGFNASRLSDGVQDWKRNRLPVEKSKVETQK